MDQVVRTNAKNFQLSTASGERVYENKHGDKITIPTEMNISEETLQAIINTYVANTAA